MNLKFQAKTVATAGRHALKPAKAIERPSGDIDKSEEDVTITSDISSLETYVLKSNMSQSTITRRVRFRLKLIFTTLNEICY